MNNFLHFIWFINFCVWIVMSYFITNFAYRKFTKRYRGFIQIIKTFYVRSNMIKGLLLDFGHRILFCLLYNMYVYIDLNKGQLK